MIYCCKVTTCFSWADSKPQDKSLGTRRLISGILGASVANLSITGLKDNVVISLRNTEPIPVGNKSFTREKQPDC